MSEASCRFYVTCPVCKEEWSYCDCYETDNWVDLFAWTGCPAFSHTCRQCGQVTPGDDLYKRGLIRLSEDALESYHNLLSGKYSFWLDDYRNGRARNNPDYPLVVQRLHALLPEDPIFSEAFRTLQAVHRWGPRAVRKLEVYLGPVLRRMVHAPGGLRKVWLHNGVTSIGPGAFRNCGALNDLYLPDSVREIGEGAFEDSGLTTCRTPEGLTKIPDRAFRNCQNLKGLFLPDTLKEIGSAAFENCRWMTEPVFPQGLISIGENAYRGCECFREITIPPSVTHIGPGAFARFGNLIIRGIPGTEAERYAVRENLPFQPLAQ